MAAGLPLPSANDNAWATAADEFSNSISGGFVKDEAIANTTGVFTTNATFASATTFTTATDTTATYTPGRRLVIVHAGGTSYCKVQNSVFGATTTVTITNVTSGPTAISTPITSVAFGKVFAGTAGNDLTLADQVMLARWGLT